MHKTIFAWFTHVYTKFNALSYGYKLSLFWGPYRFTWFGALSQQSTLILTASHTPCPADGSSATPWDQIIGKLTPKENQNKHNSLLKKMFKKPSLDFRGSQDLKNLGKISASKASLGILAIPPLRTAHDTSRCLAPHAVGLGQKQGVGERATTILL